MPTIKRLKDIRAEHQLQYKRKGLNKKQQIIQEPNISQIVYNSNKWKKLRELYYSEHPLCEQCLEKGIIKATEQVHHKIEFLSGKTYQDKLNLAYDYDNLQSLCKECHIAEHKKRRKERQNKEQNI